MRSVAMANNFQWVELPERDATYNASNDKNSFIATHPGDKGIRLIAYSILTAIQKDKMKGSKLETSKTEK